MKRTPVDLEGGDDSGIYSVWQKNMTNSTMLSLFFSTRIHVGRVVPARMLASTDGSPGARASVWLFLVNGIGRLSCLARMITSRQENVAGLPRCDRCVSLKKIEGCATCRSCDAAVVW